MNLVRRDNGLDRSGDGVHGGREDVSMQGWSVIWGLSALCLSATREGGSMRLIGCASLPRLPA